MDMRKIDRLMAEKVLSLRTVEAANKPGEFLIWHTYPELRDGFDGEWQSLPLYSQDVGLALGLAEKYLGMFFLRHLHSYAVFDSLKECTIGEPLAVADTAASALCLAVLKRKRLKVPT